MPGLAKKLEYVQLSPVLKLATLLDEALKRPNVISFGGGAPSISPLKDVTNHMITMLQTEPIKSTAYGGTRGFMELRQLISEDLKKYGGVNVDPEKELIVTDGASEGILLALMAVMNPGDEVIVTDPTYLSYPESIKVCEAKVVTLPVYVEEGFQPDVNKLKDLITEKTKAIVLLSPDNPTGRIIEKSRVQAIVDLASDHDFWVISDEIYKHIIYEGEHVWVSTLPNAWDHTVTVCSFSKTASIPGLRLGYAYGPADVVNAMEKLKQYTSLCPNALSQLAMTKFLSGDVKERYLHEAVIPTYKRRRDAMGKFLREYLPDAQIATPAGAFYYFVNMRAYVDPMKMDDEQFSDGLFEKEDVVVIPGTHFGENARQHVRMTFVSEPEERIKEGIMKIAGYFKRAS